LPTPASPWVTAGGDSRAAAPCWVGPLKVFCIGLNKTATTSLHQALEALGFRSLHWGGPATRARIERAMAEGRPLVDDLAGFEAFSDIQVLSDNFELLDRQYPGSKFILTTRELESWIESRRRHVLGNVARKQHRQYDGDFLTVDDAAWTKQYDDHHARVHAYFADRPDDLLVMDIVAGDGYELLCPFLGLPVRDEPFPWRHRGATRRAGGSGDPAGELPPLPTFIIIGAQKSATRWLRDNLGSHPEIFTAPTEVGFFHLPRRYRELGVDWYRSKFDGWAGEPIVGESTPGYMMLWNHPDEVAARIAATLPDVRLLAVLRNPIDRAHSALAHHMTRERIRPGTRLVDYVREASADDEWMGVVSGGLYAQSLQPFIERFGSQLLVLLYDDVVADPLEVFDMGRSHVGASGGHVPERLRDVLYSNRLRSDPSGERLAPEISEADRRELFTYFRDDVERLEALLGRDLAAWRPE
jgi:Sulfotransferase domain